MGDDEIRVEFLLELVDSLKKIRETAQTEAERELVDCMGRVILTDVDFGEEADKSE